MPGQLMAFEGLEPYDGKLSRTVLMGVGGGNTSCLPGNIRKYRGKFLTKPSKESIKAFLGDIRQTVKSYSSSKTEHLIHQLNPKIRGWTNYYCHVVAKEAFAYVDRCIFMALMKWMKRRHPNKGVRWCVGKYFCSQRLQNWIFFAKVRDKEGNPSYLDLFKAIHVRIRRHVKVRAEANPFDPAFKEYFLARSKARRSLLARNRRELQPTISRAKPRTSGSFSDL